MAHCWLILEKAMEWVPGHFVASWAGKGYDFANALVFRSICDVAKNSNDIIDNVPDAGVG